MIRIYNTAILIICITSCGINRNSELLNIAENEINLCGPICNKVITFFDTLTTYNKCFIIGKNHHSGELIFNGDSLDFKIPNEVKEYVNNRNIDATFYCKNHLLVLELPYRNNSLNYMRLIHYYNGIEDLQYGYNTSTLSFVNNIDSLDNNFIYKLNTNWFMVISDGDPSCTNCNKQSK